MTKFPKHILIPYPSLDPKGQLDLYSLLTLYDEKYKQLQIESETIYGSDFLISDDWNNSNLSIDMCTVGNQIYELTNVLAYYVSRN